MKGLQLINNEVLGTNMTGPTQKNAIRKFRFADFFLAKPWNSFVFSLFLHYQSDSAMRILTTILIVFLFGWNGCVNQSIPSDNEHSRKESTVLIDDMEADLVNLYCTTATTRYAMPPESATCATGSSVRVLPNRTRAVSNISMRHVLLSTDKPVVSRLIHLVITQLIAFPKEYHIFQLRRILI